jgi:transcriptional regulator with XRE-family HTH domain
MVSSTHASFVKDVVDQEERNIAERLLRLRTRLGIERDQLALAIGLQEADIFAFENAVDAIPASTLAMISAVVGIDINYFFSDEDWDIISEAYTAVTHKESALLS